ncbi:MAG: DNA polymerase III subunit alpha [Oligoflexales bacterium]
MNTESTHRKKKPDAIEHWHEWLCKTNFSFLAGASHPHELVERAFQLGYRSLAISDFDGVYGLARSFRALKTIRDQNPQADFKLHYGAEIHLEQDHDKPIVEQNTLVLIARNWIGYKNICSILSRLHLETKQNGFITMQDLLSFDLEGMVAIQPMRGVIRTGKNNDQIVALKDAFSGAFYLSLSRHLHPSEDRWMQKVVRLAKNLNIPLLLTQDAFFHDSMQKPLSDLLHAIRTNETLGDIPHHMFPNDERCLHTKESLTIRFGGFPFLQEALRNSEELHARCTFDLSELKYHYPKEFIPEGYTSQTFLEKLIWENAPEKLGTPIKDNLLQLLRHELVLISELEFADYFLTVWKIVGWARSQNILCQGRGSAANSAVCFVLGITSVDPREFNLLVERFISKERGDPPDIDVDFEHERREEVIQYIYKTFGRDRAAMVANVITFRRKGALRAVGKALGASEELLKAASDAARAKLMRGSTTEELTTYVQGKNKTELSSHEWRLWGVLASRLKGFPRHLGLHSGGFMITDKPLHWFSPWEPATKEGRTVIQWCKDDIEALGFFKIDVLALGMLTALRKSFKLVNDHYHNDYNLANIPLDDPQTYKMIQRAETVGVFQIESRAQMSMLPRLLPEKFYDLVIEIAIIRPGPIQGKIIHPYLQRRQGLEPVTYPDPKLQPILEKTLGIAIFQEQAMRIAIEVGGFSAGEANELRKNIGAWSLTTNTALDPWLQKLGEGMRKNGIKEEFAQQILGQMRGFANYGFPESHSVSFALLAYASSYLKCHYPVAFFCSILNSLPMGFYSPHALIQAAKRDKVQILPICIKTSLWDSFLERMPDNSWGIRLGFSLIHSLRKSSVQHFVEVRSRLPLGWKDLTHFLTTTHIPKNDLVSLAFADVFHSLEHKRSETLWEIYRVPVPDKIEEREDSIAWPEEGDYERIEKDFAAMGTSLHAHPCSVIKKNHWCYPVVQSKLRISTELNQISNTTRVHVFGMIISKQAPPSANGMVFVTLEDEYGFINLAFFPQAYRQYHLLVDQEAFICAEGILQRQNASHSILIKTVFAPKFAPVIPIADGKAPIDVSPQEKTKRTLSEPRSYM